MRKEPHPLTGTVYEDLGDGKVKVQKAGSNAYGIFTWQGEWLEGEVTQADPLMLLRIPGVGTKSVQLILMARKHNRLNSSHLKKMGVVMKRAQFFITCNELRIRNVQELRPEIVRQLLLDKNPVSSDAAVQLKMFYPVVPALR